MSRQMPPRKRAQVAFAAAVILLFLSGVATYTIVRLLQSEKWVVHSHEVQAVLGNVDSAVVGVGRDCSGYVITGGADFLSFEVALPKVSQALQNLRDLTRDNPEQQGLCTRLEELTARRAALFREAVELKMTAPQDRQGQADVSRRGLPVAYEITSTMQQMRDEEQKLLGTRTASSKRLFILGHRCPDGHIYSGPHHVLRPLSASHCGA